MRVSYNALICANEPAGFAEYEKTFPIYFCLVNRSIAIYIFFSAFTPDLPVGRLALIVIKSLYDSLDIKV